MKTVLCLLIIVAAANAKPQFPTPFQQDGLGTTVRPYNLRYDVANPPTNTYFGQQESGDPNNIKTGSYYVLLPDGRTMTVVYRADKDGFFPNVSFAGSTPTPPLQG